MTQPLSPEELGDLFQAIDNSPTGKLSELAMIAGLSLAEDYIGADLSDADLSGDTLSGANLSDTNLSNTNLSGTNLSRANLSGADLSGANLSGANLSGANLRNTTINEETKLDDKWRLVQEIVTQGAVGRDLSRADLSRADLSKATLAGANLDGANLTEVNAVETDFTRASMTGACLEAWNIDSSTKLDQVDCQFVYLLENPKPRTDDRERRPSIGIFQPGEFTKLFEEVLDTVDLIFHNGVDWKAFVAALKIAKYDLSGAKIYGFSPEAKDTNLVSGETVKDNTIVRTQHNYAPEKQDLAESVVVLTAKLCADNKAQLKDKKIEIQAIVAHLKKLELSWQDLSQAAQQLGCLLSLFALAPIPWSLVKLCFPSQDLKDLEEIRDDSLINLNLLQYKGDNTYQLHQLVREFLKVKLEQSDWANNLKQRFCQAIVKKARQIPQAPPQNVISEVTTAVPHIVEVATTLSKFLSDDDFCLPFVGLGRFYISQGFYQEAEPFYKNCLNLSINRFGKKHLEVVSSLNNLGNLYRNMGRYTKAIPLLKEALDLSKILLEEKHPYIGTILNNFAILYCEQGYPSKAKSLCQEALEIREEYLKENPLHVVKTLNIMAYIYSSMYDYNQAEILLKRALTYLGKNHPLVATIRNNLAYIYENRECYDEGNLFDEGDWREESIYARTARAGLSSGIGGLQDEAESLSEEAAESLSEEALELRKSFFKDKHPYVAESLDTFGEVSAKQKKDKMVKIKTKFVYF